MITTETTYPPAIAEHRDRLLRLMAEHRADAAEAARRVPRFARQIIDTAELELCGLHGELLKLELFGTPRMIVTGDDIAKITINGTPVGAESEKSVKSHFAEANNNAKSNT